MHADFGSGLWDGSRIGIPYVVVHGKTTPKSKVAFDYADESDKGPYPIPAGVPIEGAPGHLDEGDRHALIVDRDACRLYELYALHKQGGRWAAGSGAVWNLRYERASAGRVDVGRRRGAADPPRPRTLERRRVDRTHRPRAALHGAAHAARVHLSGTALRELGHRCRRCRRWGCACG